MPVTRLGAKKLEDTFTELTTKTAGMEERLISALDKLKLELSTEIKVSKTELLAKIDSLTEENSALKLKVIELEENIQSANSLVSDLTKKNDAQDILVKNLSKQVHSLSISNDAYEKKLKTVETESKEALNKHERYLREWNFRVVGMSESVGENCKSLVSKYIVKNKLITGTEMEVASYIETAHRTGIKSKDKPRQIIVRFYTRQIRNDIFIAARNLPGTDKIHLLDDLTKPDLLLKYAARKQMNEAYSEGKKVAFRRGRLLIDGHVVEIKKS